MVVIVGIIIIVFVVATVLIVFQIQQNEKKRLEREKERGLLKNQASALKEVIDNLPVHYMGKVGQGIFAELLIANLKRQENLDRSDSKLPNQMQAAESRLADIAQSSEEPQSTATTLDQCKAIRNTLKQAQKVLQNAYKKRMISTPKAQAAITAIKKGFVLALVEVLSHEAAKAEQAEDHKQAVLYLRRAMSEMNQVNTGGFFNHRVLQIRDRIKDHEEKIAQQQSEEASALAEGLDEMQEEDESWKKKKF